MQQTSVRELCPQGHSDPEGRAAWNLRVFRNLLTAAETERDAKDGDISITLSIHLNGAREDGLFFLSFWLSAIRAVLGKGKQTPSVLLSDTQDSAEAQRAFILFRSPAHTDWVAMIAPDGGAETISDVASDWGRVAERTLLPPPLLQILKSSQGSLQDLLLLLNTA